jgi:chromosome segregation ATPase
MGQRLQSPDNLDFGASLSSVVAVMNGVVDRLDAVSTRLSRYGEVPEELGTQGRAFVEGIWTTARDLANEELVELRKAQDVTNAEHRRSLADAEDLIVYLEGRAMRAEELCADKDEEIAALRAALSEKDMRIEKLTTKVETLEGVVGALTPRMHDKTAGKSCARTTRDGGMSDEGPETGALFPE